MKDEFRNKSLLVVSPRFPSPYGEPLGVFVKEQVDQIKRYFKKVVVISTSPYIPRFLTPFMQPRRKIESIMSNYSYDNVNVYYTRDLILPFYKSKNKWGDKAFEKSRNILRKINFKPDIIHPHFTWPSGYAAVKLGQQLNVPVVITAHGYDVYELPFRSEKWLEKVKYSLDNSNHIITVSRSNYKILTEKLGVRKEKITIIPNGFDSKIFKEIPQQQARKELSIHSNRKVLLTVGNLIEIKGHKYLIRALKRVVEVEKDILLVIVGSGPLEESLKKLVRKLNLQNNVWLVGAKPHSEIPIWMNAADLFVLPSLSEGNPTVMFEALGVGLPFMGTAVGGVPEIITSEDYGLLCPPADPECLAEKILMALEKEWDRERIREYAKRFTWENIAKEIIDLYENLLK